MEKHTSSVKKTRKAQRKGPRAPRTTESMLSGALLLVASRLRPGGIISPSALADAMGVSVAKLALTVGVSPETLQRTKRAQAPKTQERLREAIEIIRRVSEWAGGDVQAMAWYRAEPIPAFGGRTAEALVKEGKAHAVRDYLDAVANGSFA